MDTFNPLDVVTELVNAINQGDLETALACYETEAAFMIQPGQMVTGTKAIRNALSEIIALKPTLSTEVYKIVQIADIALYCAKWRQTGTTPDGNPVEMGAASADVLRRQSDGRWLIAIDNPFGPAILDQL